MRPTTSSSGATVTGGGQYRAFDDTWRWDESAVKRLDRLEGASAHPVHKAVVGPHAVLGPSGMLAYLAYMAERLKHMRQLLKPTGFDLPALQSHRIALPQDRDGRGFRS